MLDDPTDPSERARRSRAAERTAQWESEARAIDAATSPAPRTPNRAWACPHCSELQLGRRAMETHIAGTHPGSSSVPIALDVTRAAEPAPLPYPDPHVHIAYEVSIPKETVSAAHGRLRRELLLGSADGTRRVLDIDGFRLRLYARPDLTMASWADAIACLAEAGCTIHSALRTNPDGSPSGWVDGEGTPIPVAAAAAIEAPSWPPLKPGFHYSGFWSSVLDDVAAERQRQDAEWGGPAHDDDHMAAQWRAYRQKFEDRIHSALTYAYGNKPGTERQAALLRARDAMVKIAALAVAQVEAFDRKIGP